MKKSLSSFFVLSLCFISFSCHKIDDEPPTRQQREVPEYHAIITNGCSAESKAKTLIKTEKLKVGSSVFSWENIGIQVVNGAMQSIGFNIADGAISEIQSYMFGPDATSQALREIIGQLTVINQKLDDLLLLAEETFRAIDEVQYNLMRKGYNDFNSHLRSLYLTNRDFLNNISADTPVETLKDIVMEWGSKSINGNYAPIAFSNLVGEMYDFDYLYAGYHRNLFAVYDMIVYHNTPFAYDGYDLRDQFRASLACEMMQGAMLSALYYCFTNQQSSLDALKLDIEDVLKYLETGGNPVKRDSTRLICQLDGAQFILNADALRKRTAINGVSISVYDLPFETGAAGSKYGRDDEFTRQELNLILQYFGGDKNKFYDILRERGLIFPSAHTISLSNTYLINQTSTGWAYIDFNDVVVGLDNGLPCESIELCRVNRNSLFLHSGYLDGNIPFSTNNLSIFSVSGLTRYSQYDDIDW